MLGGERFDGVLSSPQVEVMVENETQKMSLHLTARHLAKGQPYAQVCGSHTGHAQTMNTVKGRSYVPPTAK